MPFLKNTYEKSDIEIYDGNVSVKGVGRVALWWRHGDKKVCIDYSLKLMPGCDPNADSFKADTEDEVIDGILKIFNYGKLLNKAI